MKDTQNFTAQRLPNGVTEITDLSGVHCFLVEGRDKALLIDTMTGLRGLPAFVATLTDLPVEVALTHGHMDHAGGVFEFGRCYIHPADIPMLDGRTLASSPLIVTEGVPERDYAYEVDRFLELWPLSSATEQRSFAETP